MSKSPSRIAVIVVLYREYEHCRRLLETASAPESQAEFIIVDNTEAELQDQSLRREWEQRPGGPTLIATPENLGYFGAVRFALEQRPDLIHCDLLAVANADIQFRIADLELLLERASPDPRIGVFAPRLVRRLSTTGANDLACRPPHYVSRPSARHYKRLVAIFSSYPLAVVYRLLSDAKSFLRRRNTGRTLPERLFAPHGAFMIFTQSYLSRTEGFRHDAFLFCEEIYVGTQLVKAGLTCVPAQDVPYSHIGHGSMPSVPSRWLIRQMLYGHRAALKELPMSSPRERTHHGS